MTVIYSVLGAVAGGLIGAICAAFVFMFLGGIFGISDFDGERAMGAAIFAAPLGAIAGAVFGCLVVLKRRRNRATDRTGFIAMGLVVVSIIGLFLYFFYEPPAPVLRPGDPEPVMAFEIQLPVNLVDAVNFRDIRPQLRTHMTYAFPNHQIEMRRNGTNAILSGEYDFLFRVRDREVHLLLSNGWHLIFRLPYGELPDVEPEFSKWRLVDEIDLTDETAPPPQPDGIAIRTRISWKSE